MNQLNALSNRVEYYDQMHNLQGQRQTKRSNVRPPFRKSRSDKSHWNLNTEAFNSFDRKIGLYLIKSQNNGNNL
jgi:hypothetical protein